MDIDLCPLLENWRFLLQAVGMTLVLSVLSIVLGLAIGVVCGALRTYGGRVVDVVLGLYVDLVRSIPVLAILVWTYFAFPLFIGHSLTRSPAACWPSASISAPT